MESAPASIPATTPAAFTGPFGQGTLKCSPSSSCRPALPASRITGTKPAEPIRFGSSKTADTLCDACTCRMPLRTVRIRPFASPILPCRRGIRMSRPAQHAHQSVDQGSAPAVGHDASVQFGG